MVRYDIQPLSFGGLFDRGFQLLRNHFALLTLAFLCLNVPLQVVMDWSGLGNPDPAALDMGRLFTGLGVILLFAMVYPLAQLAVTVAVADVYLGRSVTLGDALRRARGLYFPYLGTSMLMMLFLVLLMLLLVVPAIYFAFAWALIGPIAVVEGVFGRAALKRSRELVRGSWWRMFGAFMVVGFVTGFASAGFELIFSMIPVLGPVLTGAVGAVTAAYGSAVVVVVYIDQRCRKESFDLQLLASEIGGAAPSAAATPAPTHVAPV